MTALAHLASDTDPLLDDLSAVRRFARTGDPRAFEVLVHRYQGMVLATCRRALIGADAAVEAEDAAQETFLRLAKNAGQVRNNIAAWLHACAVRTSIDLRRRREVRDRAEKAAAPASSHEAATWADLEPRLDAALASLREADRDLIVQRFLAGRPQTDLAAEAGVTPSAIHRRLDRALDRLRDALGTAGLVVAAGAMPVLLDAAAPPQVSATLTASLMKTGLVSMKPAASAAAAWLVPAAVAAVGIAAVAVPLALMGGPGRAGGPGARAAAASVVPAAERPKGRFALSAIAAAHAPSVSMTSDGARLRFTWHEAGPAGVDALVFRVDAVNESAKPPTMRLITERAVSPEPGRPAPFQAGQALDVVYEIDGDFLTMNPARARGEPEHDMSFEAFRWKDAPLPAVVPAANAPAPFLAGRWADWNQLTLQFRGDDIVITAGDGTWVMYRFTVLEWTPDPTGPTRIRAICADSGNGIAVGKRAALLLDTRGEAVRLAFNEFAGPAVGQFPRGFEPDAAAMTLVMTWKKVAP